MYKTMNIVDSELLSIDVVGQTNFEGIASIEGSDWTDTDLRAAQRKYLCGLPSAKGTNLKTGVDTRESLLCDS
jgi:hypothetical protein